MKLPRFAGRTASLFSAAALLLLLALAPGHANAQSALAEDNGFMGYMLGQPSDSMDGIVRRGKSQRLIWFAPEEKNLTFEGMPLKSVRLYFWKGKLHSIEIKTSGTNSDRFKEWLENRYGKGAKEDAMGFRFSWEAPRIRVLFEQNIISHDALTTYIDDEVHEAYYRFMHRLKYGD
ncbi:MAG: hypothetical protein AAF570_07205 [Bacteroidota bacterium]